MKKLLKWLLRILGVLGVLLVVAVTWIYFSSEAKFNHVYEFETNALTLPAADSTTIAHGLHIARTRGCMDCHGQNLAGRMFMDGMPMARVSTPNLTPAGPVGTYSTDEWLLSIRHGIDREGKPFWIMPSDAYTGLSAEDLGSLIVYLKNLDPIEGEPMVREIGPIGRMLVATGGLQFPVLRADHARPFPIKPPVGPTAEYGNYLIDECRHCHGQNLAGGLAEGDPASPLSANLTPGVDGIGHYDAGMFMRALRTGVKADGTVMNPEYMPWSATTHFTDEEIAALWNYLQTLAPAPTGP